MSEADCKVFDPQSSRALFCGPVKPNVRLAASVGHDFHLTPANPTHTRSERFRDRLFRGEPGCQLARAAPAIAYFARSVYPVQETLAVTLKHAFDPFDFYGIDAGGQQGGDTASGPRARLP